MKKNIAKKTIILYVLDMLEKGSSKEKPITITSMTKVLNSIGIPCDRRTVGRNVNYLIEYGKPVVKINGGGCYWDAKSNDVMKKDKTDTCFIDIIKEINKLLEMYCKNDEKGNSLFRLCLMDIICNRYNMVTCKEMDNAQQELENVLLWLLSRLTCFRADEVSDLKIISLRDYSEWYDKHSEARVSYFYDIDPNIKYKEIGCWEDISEREEMFKFAKYVKEK